ncbi:MAG: hypothetical protein PHF17_07280 [Arcobacteraceae bacterium]|jgi:hypothetical protein|nr:hypothetical protein [Arcobacteraceae bacterium]
MKLLFKKILFVVLLLSYTIGSDLDDGFSAYDKKDYQTALNLFEKACNSGNDKGCKAYKELKNRLPICSMDELSFLDDNRYFKIGVSDSYPAILADSKTIQIDKKNKTIKVWMLWIANQKEQEKFIKDYGSKYKKFGYFKRLISIDYGKMNYKAIKVTDFDCSGKSIISFDFKDVKWKKIRPNGKIEKITKVIMKKYNL